MRYLALATDYDGTLAAEGRVSEASLGALRRLKDTGRRLILVTGRELDDLLAIFPDYAIFDRIVAENGAVVFDPATREERALAEPPSPLLVQRLAALGVTPLSCGRVIVATWSPHEKVVLEAIHTLGLELQVIFNKGAVMILPSGINKASGLRTALGELALSSHNTVAIGDAENDHALLAECELGAAVANALPLLKQRADWVTESARGQGVCELIEALVTSDLRWLEKRLGRHALRVGTFGDGSAVTIHAYGRRLLVSGASGSGKSTLATAFLEGLIEQRYQYCLVDPEGDFHELDTTLELGDEQHAPKADDVLGVLKSAAESVCVNLLGVALDQRSAFLTMLLARCAELRAGTGRPHWFVVDEAHHMLPAGDVTLPEPIAHAPSGLMLITVHPEKLAASVLAQIDTLIVVGRDAEDAVRAFAEATGREVPVLESPANEEQRAVIWRCGAAEAPRWFSPAAPANERRRHRRKYAAGSLGEDKSFYFRGPDQKLNLRANNLTLFLQMGDGVDDETWLHHLRAHDYSRWVRVAIKNDALADAIEAIENQPNASATDTRQSIRRAIEKLYTLPA